MLAFFKDYFFLRNLLKFLNYDAIIINLNFGFLLGIFISSLANTNLFFHPSQSAIYLFEILTLLYFALTLIVLLCLKKFDKITFNLQTLLLLFWLLYISLYHPRISAIQHYYTGALVFSIALLINMQRIITQIEKIFNVLVWISLGEFLLCLLQYFRIVNSVNPYFNVSGSWENPNVTAMFICMTMPITVLRVIKNINAREISILTLQFIAIVLLGCRSALIGSILVVITIMVAHQYLYGRLLKSKVGGAILLILLCVATLAFGYLMRSKTNSSQGRVFVWEICTRLINKNAVAGVGYGNFRVVFTEELKRYSLSAMNKMDFNNAKPVYMAYNDLLQNWIEGGFLGVVLFVLICITPFTIPFIQTYKNYVDQTPDQANILSLKDIHIACYVGGIAFTAMSFINFAVEALPAFLLFLTFQLVLFSGHLSNDKVKLIISLKKKVHQTVILGLIIVGVVCTTIYCKQRIVTGIAEIKNYDAYLLNRSGNHKMALMKLKPLAKILVNNGAYWQNYGLISLELGDYKRSISELKRSDALCPELSNLEAIGFCYEKLGYYTQAAQYYRQGYLVQVSSIKSRMQFIFCLIKMRQIAKARFQAQLICELKPKISNKTSLKYLEICKCFLSNENNFISFVSKLKDSREI